MRALNLLLAATASWGMVIRGSEQFEPVTRLRTVELVADQSALEAQQIPADAVERDAPAVARQARPAMERMSRNAMLACDDVNRGSTRC
jgi:hypothetical protein